MDAEKKALCFRDQFLSDESVENEVLMANTNNYNYEERRLKTFASWPAHYPVNPTRLAKSGFYYAGSEDEVICFSCNGHISHWQYGDIVQKRHMELFPHCDFINNKSNNVSFISSKQSTLDKAPLFPLEFSENSDSAVLSSVQNHTNPVMCNDLLVSNDVQSTLCKNQKSDKMSFANSDAHHSVEKSIQLLQTSDLQSNDFQNMLSENERLKTFKFGWPLAFIDVTELAKAGFFFLGCEDKVQCAFCRGIVKNWEAGDIPITEHCRHFPHCEFVLAKNDERCGLDSVYRKQGYDVCGNSEQHCVPDPLINSYKLIDKSQHHTKLEELGVNIYKGPTHPQQATLVARLRSFISWPSTAPVKKEDLADAGFFYIGISDHTKCFHCDGGLCSWEPGDDPWIEHARWFRNCSFVRLSKGDNFIKLCVAKHPTSMESEKKTIANSNAVLSSDSLLFKVEEYMKSSLVTAVLETCLFPPYIVRAAVFQQLKVNGVPFANVDQVCETVALLKEEMESESYQMSKVEETVLVSTRKKPPQCTKDLDPSITTENISIAGENSLGGSGGNMQLADKIEGTSQGHCNSILEENRFLRDQRLCKVCMDKEVGVVFLPCGHLLACTLCAPSLNDCPMCRKPIQATVRAYLP